MGGGGRDHRRPVAARGGAGIWSLLPGGYCAIKGGGRARAAPLGRAGSRSIARSRVSSTRDRSSWRVAGGVVAELPHGKLSGRTPTARATRGDRFDHERARNVDRTNTPAAPPRGAA